MRISVCYVNSVVIIVVDCGFFALVMRLAYLILCDETVWLYGFLPLEEYHVVERGEGQGLWSDAARNYGRRENNLL